MDADWAELVPEQLDWHWQQNLRPRFAGLTDDEYFWEPVPNCWSVRVRGQARTSLAAGGGDFVIDFEYPEPSPAPVTTIAWRLAHLIVGVFGSRAASHFGGPPAAYPTFHYAGAAGQALEQLDAAYDAWSTGARGLGLDRMAQPCGPAEGPFAEYPMAALVLHINREALHHGAEIALLRDLYINR